MLMRRVHLQALAVVVAGIFLVACQKAPPQCEQALEAMVLRILVLDSQFQRAMESPAQADYEERESISKSIAATLRRCPSALSGGIMIRDLEEGEKWLPIDLVAVTSDSDLVSRMLSSREDWVSASQGRSDAYHSGPLGIAATHSTPEIVERLVAYGFDPNLIDRGGDPILVSAISRWRSTDNLEALLRAGADTRVSSPDRPTPLEFAVLLRASEAVATLLDAGALDELSESEVSELVEQAYRLDAPGIAEQIYHHSRSELN